MRYLLTFYAVEHEWMALPESERNAGTAEIGRWFAEAKETVGGYAVVQVADEAQAIEIAKRWPAGGIVEVRPVAD
jgi:hypothetical protein